MLNRCCRRALTGLFIATLAAPALATTTPADDGVNLVIPIEYSDDRIPVVRAGVTKRINVDSRPVDVTVDVSNVSFVLLPSGISRPPTTSVRVALDSGDGQALPAIRAVKVKLERVRAPMRVYTSRLTADATFVFDPLHTGYSGAITSFSSGVLLKATVTLTTADETRIVRVGRLHVRPSMLYWRGDDLTE